MEQLATIEELSLLGGPLHRVGCRLGLVRGGTNTFPLGVALGAFLWTVLIALTLIDGIGDQIFSLPVIGGHVRLLAAIPLFFLCETFVDPRMTTFVHMIVRSKIVPRNELPALESIVASITRCKDSWLAEGIFLLAAGLLSLIAPRLGLSGATAAFGSHNAAGEITMTAQWYWIVCLPFFRFLMLRWVWRLGLWSYFLWRLVRLELHLIPTHPDSAAGLGYLELIQSHFMPLVLAISVVQSAAFAEEIATGKMLFEALYPAVAITLFLEAVLFLGPLLIVAPKLWACRVKGLSKYMEFAASYINDFDKKWLGAKASPETLLGTSDLQSLADLANSMNIVRNMSWLPMSQHLLMSLAIAALLPIVPLILFKYPVAELIKKFFEIMTGM